jgi:hypothetical protein
MTVGEPKNGKLFSVQEKLDSVAQVVLNKQTHDAFDAILGIALLAVNTIFETGKTLKHVMDNVAGLSPFRELETLLPHGINKLEAAMQWSVAHC